MDRLYCDLPGVYTRRALDYHLRVACMLDDYVVVDWGGIGELLLLVPADKISIVRSVLFEHVPVGIYISIDSIAPDVEAALCSLCGAPSLNYNGEIIGDMEGDAQ